jgi:hypothetical protein
MVFPPAEKRATADAHIRQWHLCGHLSKIICPKKKSTPRQLHYFANFFFSGLRRAVGAGELSRLPFGVSHTHIGVMARS